MSVNTSSSSNDYLLHLNLSSINLLYGMHCIITRPSSLIYSMFYITNILLLLPLCILVFNLGLQRRRQQRSTSTAAKTSHSDSFTYHMVTMELVGVFGFTLCCCGIYTSNYDILSVGYCLWCFVWYGETFFHILTCVERYLAVVHPITYLSLRSERATRIRNKSIGGIWLICTGLTILINLQNVSLTVNFCLMLFALIVISFCSISVLCILIRPGPGDQGRDRERIDQSKQRAFYTIVAILGVLFLRVSWNLIWEVLYVLRGNLECVTMAIGVWVNLPSTLVLPLLFLSRACYKKNTK